MNENNTEQYDAAVLNFWCYSNYGAILTGYALQKALEEMSCSNRLIWYMNEANRNHYRECFENSHFKNFADKYIKYTPLYEHQTLAELNNHTKTFIVGSDQVWRMPFLGINRWAYYLNFANDSAKKIACAASFGFSEFIGSAEDETMAWFWLKQFDAVSVREYEARTLLGENWGIESELLIDPVFYIDKSFYENMISDLSPDLPKEYILTYFLGKTDEDQKVIDAYAKEMNLPVVDVDPAVLSTEEWLYCIKHAKLLLTNSFHGVCFSLIFHRDFICLANENKAYTRFSTIFDKLGLKDQARPSNNYFENFTLNVPQIDYAKVDAVLEAERSKALEWLKKSVFSEKVKTTNETDCVLRALSNALTRMQIANRRQMGYMYDIVSLPKLERKLRKYRLKTLFSFGRKHREYKKIKRELKNKIRFIRRLIKQNQRY